MWDERFTEVAASLPLGVLVVDSNDRLVWANRLGLAFMGSGEEAIGRTGVSHVLRDDDLRKAVSIGAEGIVQMAIHDSGKSYQTEVQSITGSNGPVRLVTLRDVTGVPHAHILRRNFIFELFHKIRTPMTTMVSVLSMAAGGQLDPTQVDVPELMSMGVQEAVRLRSLLGRLRDLFLLESNSLEQELEIQPVPVGAALEEVAGFFERRTKAKKQAFLRETPEDELLVLADPQFLTRSLSHIVYNAHIYTPEGGQIRIGAMPRPGHVRFYIEDDGPGIAEEEQSEIFECFRRGRSEATLAVEGEGLGLYLARHLIHGQNGTLHLDSAPGKGTRVEIYLPTPQASR